MKSPSIAFSLHGDGFIFLGFFLELPLKSLLGLGDCALSGSSRARRQREEPKGAWMAFPVEFAGMSQAGPTHPTAPRAPKPGPVQGESPDTAHPGLHRAWRCQITPSGGNNQCVTAPSSSAAPRKHSRGSPDTEGASCRSRLQPSGEFRAHGRRDQREWRLLTLPNPRSRGEE